MKILAGVIAFFSFANVCCAQWVRQNVDTAADLRGLAVVNEKVVWASGTGGTVIRTIDGGKTWKVMTVPGAEKLDFRDVEAFDANTADILSIGNGESSRIYKTTDGGATWNEQFRNKNEKAFFDAIACWDKKNCIAMSDPVDNKFALINTKDGGVHWLPMNTDKMPPAKEGEAAFAASGTCLITHGKNTVFLVTGGSDARVFTSADRGKSWNVYETPMIKGTPGSGIFSIAMYNDKEGVIVGGNYEKPEQQTATIAFTGNGGKSWKASTPLRGYRSAVSVASNKVTQVLVVAGTNGSDETINTVLWNKLGDENLNSIQVFPGPAFDFTIWAVGPKGLVVSRLIDIEF